MDFKKNKTAETIFLFTLIFPLALSAGVCSGMGAAAGLLFAAAASLASYADGPKPSAAVYLTLLAVFSTFNEFGAATVSLAAVISGAALAASSLFYDKLERSFADSAKLGATLACASSATVFFTNDYFGIGSTGFSVADILASYRSLGFHPNWRGVFYGTVVLVIMITFPRKFKKLGKILSASFVSLLVALVLNLFLNPSHMKTAVNEINGFSYKDAKNVILPLAFEKPDFFAAAACGLALFVISFSAISRRGTRGKRDFALSGAANGAFGFLCCAPLPVGAKREKSSFLPGAIACAASVLLLFALDGPIARIPVHACAVVLIAGAWQSVKWGEFKRTLSSPADALLFAVCFVSVLTAGAVYGTLLAFVFSASRRLFFVKKKADGDLKN